MTRPKSTSFEPLHYGNDWGIFIDIEKMEYNIHCPLERRANKRMTNTKKEQYDIESLERRISSNYENTSYYLLKVSSTTIITVILTYVVYFIL